MFGYIYITTNIITGEQYIGKHLADKFDSTYKGSGAILTDKIKEYGWDNFECHILPEINSIHTICNSLDELNAAEKYYIAYYNCVVDPHYYNLQAGGDGFSGGPVSDYTKAKISAYNKNKILIHNSTKCIKINRAELPEYIALGWIEGPAPFNRTNSFKQKVAATITGQVGMHKGKIKTKVPKELVDQYLADGYSLGWTDKKKSYVSKAVSGIGIKKYMHLATTYKLVPESRWQEFLAAGWVFGNKPRPGVKRKTGYKLSPEHIQKLKIAHLGHKPTPEAIKKQADKMKGRICIHKGMTVKYIYIADLNKYLADGWLRGRPLVPKKCSKEIVCYETGEEFSCLAAANRAYPKSGALKRCLSLGYSSTCAGYHWYFKTDTARKAWLEANIKR